MKHDAAGRRGGQDRGGDFPAVDHRLEHLHDDVADEDRAERVTDCVAAEPVDRRETDQRDADVA